MLGTSWASIATAVTHDNQVTQETCITAANQPRRTKLHTPDINTL